LSQSGTDQWRTSASHLRAWQEDWLQPGHMGGPTDRSLLRSWGRLQRRVPGHLPRIERGHFHKPVGHYTHPGPRTAGSDNQQKRRCSLGHRFRDTWELLHHRNHGCCQRKLGLQTPQLGHSIDGIGGCPSCGIELFGSQKRCSVKHLHQTSTRYLAQGCALSVAASPDPIEPSLLSSPRSWPVKDGEIMLQQSASVAAGHHLL
jgi:hypothetical protein